MQLVDGVVVMQSHRLNAWMAEPESGGVLHRWVNEDVASGLQSLTTYCMLLVDMTGKVIWILSKGWWLRHMIIKWVWSVTHIALHFCIYQVYQLVSLITLSVTYVPLCFYIECKSIITFPYSFAESAKYLPRRRRYSKKVLIRKRFSLFVRRQMFFVNHLRPIHAAKVSILQIWPCN